MVGKILGALIGYFTLGYLGALLGLIAGHFFDQGRSRFNQRFAPEQRALLEKHFFQALFPILGYIAKADGRVSEEEIKSTEELIARMGLNEAQRQEAITLFQQGKQDGFQPDQVLSEFKRVADAHPDAKRIFLVYLITLALADDVLDDSEEQALRFIAEQLSFSHFLFNQMIGMVKAQMAFRNRHSESASGYHYYEQQRQHHRSADASSVDRLKLAYQALGVSSSDSDADIKKAYRKLMSENHPDKLAGQGVPEEMIKLATERSQEIQNAYDLIKKSRK